jgi:hypothetical protein
MTHHGAYPLNAIAVFDDCAIVVGYLLFKGYGIFVYYSTC